MSKIKATIRKRFTLVIPKEIREQLSLEEQDTVSLSVNEGRIIIEPIGKDSFEKLALLGKGVKYNRTERKKASKLLEKTV